MDPEFDPVAEGKRIVREYLSSLGWARARRRIIIREVRPAISREEQEERYRDIDRAEEDAEEHFGKEVDRWRTEGTQSAKQVLETIVKELGHRIDLGFFGKRIVARLKDELERKQFK